MCTELYVFEFGGASWLVCALSPVSHKGEREEERDLNSVVNVTEL